MRVRWVVALLLVAATGAAWAQSTDGLGPSPAGGAPHGIVPGGAIIVVCDVDCTVRMPEFGFERSARAGQRLDLGGIPAGSYRVEVTSETGTAELDVPICQASATVTVARDGTRQASEPCPPVGTLVLIVPDGASVRLLDRTFTADATLPVFAGAYRVVLQPASGGPVERTVDVAAGQEVEVRVPLPDGSIALTGVPEGATVQVDGAAPVPASGPLDLPPGSHDLVVAAPGYESQTRTVTVRSGGTTDVSVALSPAPTGTLVVDADPSTAVVEVEGVRAFVGRPVTLAAGEHTITVSATGRVPDTRTVTVRAGGTVRVSVVLARAFGNLRVSTDPSDATLRVDGVERSPGRTVRVPAGPHDVTVEAPGYEPAAKTVTVSSAGTAEVQVALVPLEGYLQVKVFPAGGTYRVDGATHSSDARVALPVGTHEVVVSAPEALNQTVEVDVRADRVAWVVASLVSVRSADATGSADVAYGAVGDEPPAMYAGSGALILDLSPDGAYAMIDGSRYASGDRVMLRAGDYVVTVTGPGRGTSFVGVTVMPGTTQTLRVDAPR